MKLDKSLRYFKILQLTPTVNVNDNVNVNVNDDYYIVNGKLKRVML